MKITTALLSIALLGVTGLTTAATADKLQESTYQVCQSNAVSTNDMMECIYAEYKVLDNRLNAVYKKLNERQSKTQKSKLVDAQRAWMKYRDANCKFYADPDGGTEAMLSSNLCILDMTVTRTIELQKLN